MGKSRDRWFKEIGIRIKILVPIKGMAKVVSMISLISFLIKIFKLRVLISIIEIRKTKLKICFLIVIIEMLWNRRMGKVAFLFSRFESVSDSMVFSCVVIVLVVVVIRGISVRVIMRLRVDMREILILFEISRKRRDSENCVRDDRDRKIMVVVLKIMLVLAFVIMIVVMAKWMIIFDLNDL